MKNLIDPKNPHTVGKSAWNLGNHVLVIMFIAAIVFVVYELLMTELSKIFEPSKERLINNARTMMLTAQDPWFKSYWEKVYKHLLKVYGRLN